MRKLLRPLSFSLMGIIILLLITASIVEKTVGTNFAVRYFYTAPWTIALWAAAVISGLCYLFTQKVYKQWITGLLHFSFVIILGGALITHCFGKQGQIHLRLNSEPATAFTMQKASGENVESSLPFSIQLTDFDVLYYPGTQAPMDFVSRVSINNGETQGEISMNHILTYKHYRFYQARYDSDGLGTTFSVSYDPWGIGITYTGYALLLLSIIGFFFQKRTHFRTLLQSPLLKTAALALLFTLSLTSVSAANTTPPTIDYRLAEQYCNLYVYYNNRVCPLQTLANDFTTKLYGKNTYKGLTAQQVLCGWIFFYDDWAAEPCIKIKGKDIQVVLGIKGKYAALNDYVSHGKYKLQQSLQEGNKNARLADEKFQLISMLCTGTMLRLYPVTTNGNLHWYYGTEPLPTDISTEDWQFITGAMEYVALCIMQGDNYNAWEALAKMRLWQQTKAGTDCLPSPTRFRAEVLYNNLNFTRPLAMACATIGLILFFVCCLLLAQGKQLNQWIYFTLMGLMAALWLFLTTTLILRWIASGHVPLSNGHETMQFLAWVSALLTLIITATQYRKPSLIASLALPFGYLLCGMTLMVSMMSGANPQVSNLMPVLQSPLLTIHVAIIMIAYCLLAFVMLNGLTAIILHIINKIRNSNTSVDDTIARLQVISHILLYPAIFCLTIGIFIGAVWANISWGRYWGWDPKEVWALITMLVYAALLHTNSLRFLRKPLAFHIYSVLAFLFVLFTYFGVNFLLGGMHSYA